MEGYLRKRGGPAIKRNWQKRLFKVNGSLLEYYKGETMSGSIKIATITGVHKQSFTSLPRPKLDIYCGFDISTNVNGDLRTYSLLADTGEEADTWVAELKKLSEAVNVPDQPFEKPASTSTRISNGDSNQAGQIDRRRARSGAVTNDMSTSRRSRASQDPDTISRIGSNASDLSRLQQPDTSLNQAGVVDRRRARSRMVSSANNMAGLRDRARAASRAAKEIAPNTDDQPDDQDESKNNRGDDGDDHDDHDDHDDQPDDQDESKNNGGDDDDEDNSVASSTVPDARTRALLDNGVRASASNNITTNTTQSYSDYDMARQEQQGGQLTCAIAANKQLPTRPILLTATTKPTTINAIHERQHAFHQPKLPINRNLQSSRMDHLSFLLLLCVFFVDVF